MFMARNGLAHNEPWLWDNRYMVYNGKLFHRTVYEKYYGIIPKGMIVHHVNENRLDNRPENLKLLTRAVHCKLHKRKTRGLSSKPYKNNTSGVPGITFHRPNGKWRVRIGGKHIGLYKDKEDAIAARQYHTKCLK